MKTKDIKTLLAFLSFCVLLLISSLQIAAQTFSDSASLQHLQALNTPQQNGFDAIFTPFESDHRHSSLKFYETEDKVEEDEVDSLSSRKTVPELLPEWGQVCYIVSQLSSDFIRRPLQRFHFFYNASDNRYLTLQVFRI